MDGARFDTIVRSLAGPRRAVLSGAVAIAMTWPGIRSSDAGKKRRRRRRKSKLRFNEFGCITVGGRCRGNDAHCCSGRCEGKKPKKGKKDRSRCVDHDARFCLPETDACVFPQGMPCDPENAYCACALTTGNAGFCGDFTGGLNRYCWNCSRDTDCEKNFGVGAACILLTGLCEGSCAETGDTACVPPCATAV